MPLLLCLLLALPALAQRDVPVDNEFVRVLKVTSSPGPKGRLHDHKVNRVMIYLDPGQQKLEYADGKSEDLRFQAGQALWSPKSGMHTSQNVGTGSWRVVEVELKQPPRSSKSPWTSLDPVKVDPRHYKVEFENEQVRVVRFRNEPNGKIPLHEHAVNRVVVFLTPVAMKVTPREGAASELRKEAGDIAWSGPAIHSEENLSKEPIELLVVELK